MRSTINRWGVMLVGAAMLSGAPAATAEEIATVEPDVIYGRADALALTYDLLKPTAEPNGATVIFMVSGGWVSRWFDPRLAMAPEIRGISLVHDLLLDGYHIVLLRHGS